MEEKKIKNLKLDFPATNFNFRAFSHFFLYPQIEQEKRGPI